MSKREEVTFSSGKSLAPLLLHMDSWSGPLRITLKCTGYS